MSSKPKISLKTKVQASFTKEAKTEPVIEKTASMKFDPVLFRTMLKLALDTDQVSPEEVYAVLQQKQQGKVEDKNTETVDSEVLDSESPTRDDANNDEGKVLEQAFKELDIEDAIEKAKENKKYEIPLAQPQAITGPNNYTVQKTASMWDLLKEKYAKEKHAKFYVDSQCIDCDRCGKIAPNNFVRDPGNGVYKVAKQPTTDSEEKKCFDALRSCPVDAISNKK